MGKKKDVHICTECVEEFTSKEVFTSLVPDREYYTIYCKKCMISLGITKCRPYNSNTFKSEYILVEDIGIEKKTTKKKTTTKETTKKNK